MCRGLETTGIVRDLEARGCTAIASRLSVGATKGLRISLRAYVETELDMDLKCYGTD